MNKFQLKPTIFGQDIAKRPFCKKISPNFDNFLNILGQNSQMLKINPLFSDFYLGNITTEQFSVKNYHILSRYC